MLETTGVDQSHPLKLRYAIFATDAIVLIAATIMAFQLRFDELVSPGTLFGPIQIIGSFTPPLWLVVLVYLGAYDRRVIGLGLSEYGRILQSAVVVLLLISLISFLGKFDTSRAYVILVVPFGVLGLLIERWLWRRVILRNRRQGKGLRRTLVIGSKADCADVTTAFSERPWAGYLAVDEMRGPVEQEARESEFEAWLDAVMARIEESDVACIALTPSSGLDGTMIRDLSWRMEGRGLDLLLNSALGPVTGPRLTLRVATGLPYVHLDEVSLRTSQRVAKRAFDLVGGSAILILLSPLLFLLAIVSLLAQGRPVFFTQSRAGLDGKPFRIFKFRTMSRDAEQRRGEMVGESSNGPIVKAEHDPRVTGYGRFLRRWSLDELPQLFNVLTGQMSLVGPRPHPFDDVSRYGQRDHRRLLAKPGMTGLWQVAGRSDLSWDDAIELDLIYIENWTFTGDIAILARTAQAVLLRQGAY